MNSLNHSVNPGVFFIKSGDLDIKSVTPIVRTLINQVGVILGMKNFSPKFNINVVNVKNKPIYSYAFIDDKRVVNILQGLNPDGSKRFDVKTDPSCKFKKLNPKKLKESLNKSLANLSKKYFDNMWDDNFDVKKMKPSKPFSWADYQEEEDDIKCDHTEKKIKTPLPPLMTTPFKHNGIEILPAAPRDDVSNTLGASGIGKNITVDDIKEVFNKYDTKGNYYWDTKTEQKVYYPIVTRHEDKVTIKFDPQSIDSSYAIHMQKKTVIKGQEILFYSTK